MDRTERFYKIQKLLEERQVVTAEQFLKVLEVSRATFRRDLEYLRDRLGTPIEWNADLKGYTLNIKANGKESLTALPGLWLNDAEIYSWLSVIELLKNIEPNGMVNAQVNPIRSRLEKLLDESSFSLKEVAKRIQIVSLARRRTSPAYFELIANALLARKRIYIRYLQRYNETVSEREVSPQRLVYYRDNWYLDAFCHDRDDLRTFSLDAIETVKGLEKSAVSVDENVLVSELESSYGIFAGKKYQIAKLKFTPFRARWVSKELWHPKQRGEVMEDGSYLLEIPYSDERELTLDILRQGAEVEVVDPPALRSHVIELLVKTVAIYHG
ncbi:putative DeoR family regulatory protein [beta proteobacterium CB]|nr:putative DeoR family regulatory protein [beta proteobacterium CB]